MSKIDTSGSLDSSEHPFIQKFLHNEIRLGIEAKVLLKGATITNQPPEAIRSIIDKVKFTSPEYLSV